MPRTHLKQNTLLVHKREVVGIKLFNDIDNIYKIIEEYNANK